MSGLTGTVTVKNVEYAVTFSEWEEKFCTTVGYEDVSSKSWTGLKAAIAKATRKQTVRVEVPFVDHNGRKGVALGLHAGNGNLLVNWEDRNATEQERSVSALSPDTDAAELKRLIKASADAERALRDFRAQHALENGERFPGDLKAAVRQAIEAEVERRTAEEATTDGSVHLDQSAS